MEPKFNIDRPKVTDEEINKHKDFERLVKQFKNQSIQKARHDKSWWKSKKVRYSTVIAGITVICTLSYLTVFKNQTSKSNTNETLTTLKREIEPQNTEASAKKAFIAPPSQKLSIPYSSYKVNNAKGGEIKHSTSSKIKIPKNSFVDKNGKDVIGDVTIEYREFHDKGDVILSGIPMVYDSAGTKRNFESAGMFDIKGTHDGEPVFIRKDKKLEVELASTNDEMRFNQYYLDTADKSWKHIRRDIPVKVKDESQKSKESPETSKALTSTPKMEKLKNDIEVVIPKRIDSVKTVYTKKTEALPKAKEPYKPAKPSGKQTFNIDASPSEFPELAAFKNLIFELGDENKNYSKEMNEITWNDLKISEGPQKGKNYLLTLKARNRTEKLIVYPVLTGADFEAAQKKYSQKFEEYQGLVVKRENDEKKLLAELEAKQKAYMAEIEKKKAEYEKARAEMLAKYKSEEANELANGFNKMSNDIRAKRIFQVASFGIYNSDCAHDPEQKSVAPIFALDNGAKTISPNQVFLVDHTKNMVVSYTGGSVAFNPRSTNSFVVFVKNKMYLCSKTDFKEGTENNNKFYVTALPDEADNIADFKKALEI